MTALDDLPGSSADAGSGPVVPELTETLLDDAGTLERHREHRAAWYGECLGPLIVPADAVEPFAAALSSREHALPIMLAGRDRQQAREARDLLAEDDRVELAGVRLPLPVRSAEGAEQLLSALDFTAPAWIELQPEGDWPGVLDVIAADGAEHLTLLLDGATPEAAAALIRTVVDRDLSFRLGDAGLPLITSGAGPFGLLNVLCAVRAALNGADEPALAPILAETTGAPLTSALRRMSEADAAVTRAFVVAVRVEDVETTVAGLVELGLLVAE